MKPKFHYQITGELIRSVNNTENPIVINKEFYNPEPVLAREEAIGSFMSFVEVMLEFYGLKFSTHEEALERLNRHVSKGKKIHIKMGDNLIDKLDNDFDLGLNLYLIKDNTKFVKSLEGNKIYTQKLLIHSFSADFKSLAEMIFTNLELEYKWYKENRYKYRNYEVRYDFTKFPVLQTPVDFNKYTLDWVFN